jgi:hypothetical protein
VTGKWMWLAKGVVQQKILKKAGKVLKDKNKLFFQLNITIF